MSQNEIDEMSEKISNRVYEKIISSNEVIRLLELAKPENLDRLAEVIATKINEKLEADGKFDLSNVDVDMLANLANTIQEKIEPDVIVKKLDP